MREKSPSVPLIRFRNGSVFQASKIQVNGNTYIKKIHLKIIYNQQHTLTERT